MVKRLVRLFLIALVLAAVALVHAQEIADAAQEPREVLRAAPPQAGAAHAGSRRVETATVLLVDDDWDYQFTHPGSLGGLPFYTSALDLLGISWEGWDVQTQGQPPGSVLAGHQAVIWFTGYAYGELGDDPGVFTPQNEDRVGNYLLNGGNLILSSQEYYFDCCEESGLLTQFMQDYLGLSDVNADVAATATAGVSGNPIGDGVGPFRMARPDDYGVYWPPPPYEGPYDDELLLQPSAQAPFVYASPWNTGYSAANFEGATFKTIFLAWPLEWIDTVGERAQILGLALSWMGGTLPAPADVLLGSIDNADENAEYLVDWSDATGATSYLLEEDDDPYFGSPVIRYAGANSQFEATQQPEGTWYYRVRADNPDGYSDWSNARSADVTIAAPLAPELLPIDNPEGYESFVVDWGAAAGATSYTLEADRYSSFYSPEVKYSGSETSLPVSDHAPGMWYYRVRSTGEGGTSVWSNVETVVVRPLLYPISNPEGDGSYVVSWQAPAGALDYTLQEDDNPQFSTPAVRYSGAGLQCAVAGQPLGPWFYRLRANYDSGPGPWSEARSTGVFSGAPTLLPIENPDGDSNYLVDWSGVGGAAGFRLEEDNDASFASPSVRYEGADTQYEITGQFSGTWHYRVLAYNEGGVSPYSNVESVSLSGLYLPLILRSR